MAAACLYAPLFLCLCAGFGAAVSTVILATGPCQGISYGPLGCFTRDFPFNNTLELPQDPEFINTSFYLFTRRNPHIAQPLITADGTGSIGGSNFNPRQPTKILIHGFLQNFHSPWVIEMTHDLLEQGDVNVVTVDWGVGAGFPYTQAAANIRVVGAEVNRLVSRLVDEKGTSPRWFHVIGHSLGSHAAGHVGRLLQGSLGRISGLDPADPNFTNMPPEVRLDPTDARWVDVIHTDGSPYTMYGGYGTMQPMGHIDFFPNGGKEQPGCRQDRSIYNFLEDAYHEGMTNAEYSMSCSHERSVLLFLESIRSSCPFTSYPCASKEDFKAGQCLQCGNRPCPSMGYFSDQYKQQGSFYLSTYAMHPFCGFHYLVRVKLGRGTSRLTGSLHAVIGGDRGVTPDLTVYRGQTVAGELVGEVILAPVDVGYVRNITLTFQLDSTIFSWPSSRTRIEVDSVMTQRIQSRNTVYFCPSTQAMLLPEGPLHLSGPSSATGCQQ